MAKNLFIFSSKKLPRAFLLAVLLLSMVYFVELFILPIDCFTFRVWESLIVARLNSLFPGPFYPKMKISKVEQGDLGHHTRFAVPRYVEWETDRYGYRNRERDIKQYDIVIVGGSSIAGTGLTQEDTLSEVLERKLGRKVYALACQYSPKNLLYLLDNQRFTDHPPEIVIFEIAERMIPNISPIDPERQPGPRPRIKTALIDYFRGHPAPAILLDRFCKNAMFNYINLRIKQIVKRGVYEKRFVHLERQPSSGQEVPENMLFLFEVLKNKQREFSERELESFAQIICGYKAIFQQRGIRLIFLPVPEKETIYYQYLLYRQRPQFLDRLRSKLSSRGVEAIDLQGAFERAYRDEKVLLYQTDDSHWNAAAVKLSVDLLARQINSTKPRQR